MFAVALCYETLEGMVDPHPKRAGLPLPYRLIWILLALLMSKNDPMLSPEPKLTSLLEKYPSIGSPPLLLLEEELPF